MDKLRRPQTPRMPLLAAAIMCAALTGCGPATGDATDRDQREMVGTGGQAVSPEVIKLDQELYQLEGRAEHLVANVQNLERLVTSKMGAADSSAVQNAGDRMFIEVDGDDVLRLNGIAMSAQEIQQYIMIQGQKVCQPQPTVVVDPEANYDNVATIIEMIYAQDCGGVDVVQQSPSKLKANK
jgi:biopolymer transport protein ExbD